MKKKRILKRLTKADKRNLAEIETCECSLGDRRYLIETINNENFDLYYCPKHRTLELFNNLTKEKVNINEDTEIESIF